VILFLPDVGRIMNEHRKYLTDLFKGVGIGSFVAGLVKFEFNPVHKVMALTLVGMAVILWIVGFFFIKED
jgi:hypothetical protein